MFPGMNKKVMEQAMKKLGMKQEEIEATEVIIKTTSKDYVIRNPQVSKINMMGQETLQVVGKMEEMESFSEDDVKTVMNQTNKKEEEVKAKLKENNGDIAKTIIDLS
ncbi:MAG TPA: nascent polypeptide-associated complex protein [Candidatus Nanoarchaeia archaeon]|nr:nascent polypeptide-associated complex protein [Candidatus Nanoarchaeia archaeon]